MTSDYERYAILEAQINVLKNNQDELKASIIEDMVTRGEKNADTAVGKFTVAQLKTWTYSEGFKEKEVELKDEIGELNEEIKALKAKEEEDKIATYVEKPSLRFTSVKL